MFAPAAAEESVGASLCMEVDVNNNLIGPPSTIGCLLLFWSDVAASSLAKVEWRRSPDELIGQSIWSVNRMTWGDPGRIVIVGGISFVALGTAQVGRGLAVAPIVKPSAR